MAIPSVDLTTLNNLSPNLDIGDIADPALRLQAFQYIYNKLTEAVADLNAFQVGGAVKTVNLADGNVVTVKLADNAVTGPKILDGAIITAKLADGNVTTLKIADGNITRLKLADKVIGAGQLDDSAVGQSHHQDNGIPSRALPDNVILQRHMSDNSVGSAEIQAGAVQRTHLGSGVVGSGQLDPLLLTNYGDIAVQAEFDKRSINIQKYANLVNNGDWTTAIQNAINNAPSGGVILFPPGDYPFSGQITITGRSRLKLLGYNAVFKPSRFEYPFTIDGDSSYINIQGIEFNGANITTSFNAPLIFIRESKNIVIDGCTFRNLLYGTSDSNGNDGIYLRANSTALGTFIYDVEIKNCDFYDISRQSVSIVQGERINIHHCYMASRRSGVDIEPNNSNQRTKDVIIKDCIMDGRRTSSITNTDNATTTTNCITAYGFEVAGSNLDSASALVENITFESNTIYGTAGIGKGMQISRVKNATLLNNRIIGCGDATAEGYIVVKSGANRNENVIVESNYITNCGAGIGINIYGSNDVLVSRNIVENNGGTGLDISPNVSISVSHNKFINCGTTQAVKLVASQFSFTHNTVIDDRASGAGIPASAILFTNGFSTNTVKDISHNIIDGLYSVALDTTTSAASAERSYGLMICHNRVYKAAVGIIYYYCYHGSISNNYFYNTTDKAIECYKCDLTIFSNNTIKDCNNLGIRLSSGKGNKIIGNTIIDLRVGVAKILTGITTTVQTNSLAANNHCFGVQNTNSFDAGVTAVNNFVDIADQTISV